MIIFKQIEEAHKKYESMNQVEKKSHLCAFWYINEIINEVKEHATKDELNGVFLNENVIKFMKNIEKNIHMKFSD